MLIDLIIFGLFKSFIVKVCNITTVNKIVSNNETHNQYIRLRRMPQTSTRTVSKILYPIVPVVFSKEKYDTIQCSNVHI